MVSGRRRLEQPCARPLRLHRPHTDDLDGRWLGGNGHDLEPNWLIPSFAPVGKSSPGPPAPPPCPPRSGPARQVCGLNQRGAPVKAATGGRTQPPRQPDVCGRLRGRPGPAGLPALAAGPLSIQPPFIDRHAPRPVPLQRPAPAPLAGVGGGAGTGGAGGTGGGGGGAGRRAGHGRSGADARRGRHPRRGRARPGSATRASTTSRTAMHHLAQRRALGRLVSIPGHVRIDPDPGDVHPGDGWLPGEPPVRGPRPRDGLQRSGDDEIRVRWPRLRLPGTQPFDSSGYEGVSFWAGTGQMRAAVALPATTDVMFGGTCPTGCSDAFGATVEPLRNGSGTSCAGPSSARPAGARRRPSTSDR